MEEYSTVKKTHFTSAVILIIYMPNTTASEEVKQNLMELQGKKIYPQ